MYENWPTADDINNRIALSEKSNNNMISKLRGKGSVFLKFGEKYGINPAFAVAIAQKECQMACDGSTLPNYNNFGGITDPKRNRGDCGVIKYNNRDWASFCTVDSGIEGIFKVLDQKIYRNSGGTVLDLVSIYSPPNENNMQEMLRIIAVVGRQLNVTLIPTTQIYLPMTWSEKIKRRVSRKK